MVSHAPPSVEHAARRVVRPTGPRPQRLAPPMRLESWAQPPLPIYFEPEAPPAADIIKPELHRVAAVLTCAIIEVLSGMRPLAQLERRCTPTMLHVMSHIRHSRAGRGLRMRSIRVQSPCTGVLEVTATMNQGAGTRAAAIRLVKTQSGWLCTRLETSLTPGLITRAPRNPPNATHTANATRTRRPAKSQRNGTG